MSVVGCRLSETATGLGNIEAARLGVNRVLDRPEVVFYLGHHGKVNPVMPEMVNMVCFQVIGHDVTIAAAAEAGQLELNVMMPVIAFNLLFSVRLLTNASRTLAERCVKGIEADAEMARYWLDRSPAIVTALAPKIGYAEAAKLAKEAVERDMTVRALVEEKGILSVEELDEILDLRAMTEPGVPGDRLR